MKTPCSHIQKQLIDLLLGQLDRQLEKTVNLHLDSCSVCQSYFEQLRNQEKELEHMGTQITNNLEEKQEKVIHALNTLPRQAAQPDRTIWSTMMHSKITKRLAAAILIIAALTGIYKLTGSIDGASVAWADVVERFHSVDYFSAVFYHKTNAQSEPEQIEIWVGKGGKARIHIDRQVVFCSDGNIQKAFDMKNGQEAEPTQRAKGMFDKFLRNVTAFSLETFLEFSDGEKLVDVTAVVNEDSLIASELVMFDVKHQDSPQWFRIWALRQSKLPLHIRMLDPRDGGCDDVVFDYSKEPKETFFDPAEFAAKAKSVQSSNLIPYLLWEDPTGKTLTPKQPNKEDILNLQTQTIEGQPWSYADHRGKVILIQFWFGSDNLFTQFSTAVNKKFAKRDDFINTVIVLRNPEKARAWFKDKPDWILLQDSYETVQTIFGSVSEQNVFIIDRSGSFRKVSNIDTRFGVAAVEEALNGLVYDSYWSGLVSDQIIGWSEETLRQRYGNPDSTETKEQNTEWHYRRYSDEKTEYHDTVVTLDPNKSVIGLSVGHRIVDPAMVKLQISEEWWQKEIAAKIDPGLLSKPNAVFIVSLTNNKSGYPLGGDAYGSKPETFETNKVYSRRMVPGTYDLEIKLRETQSPYQQFWSQILIKDLELAKNQEKLIEF